MRQLAVANVEHRDIVIVQVAKDVEQEAEEVDPEGDELEPEFVLKGDGIFQPEDEQVPVLDSGKNRKDVLVITNCIFS